LTTADTSIPAGYQQRGKKSDSGKKNATYVRDASQRLLNRLWRLFPVSAYNILFEHSPKTLLIIRVRSSLYKVEEKCTKNAGCACSLV